MCAEFEVRGRAVAAGRGHASGALEGRRRLPRKSASKSVLSSDVSLVVASVVVVGVMQALVGSADALYTCSSGSVTTAFFGEMPCSEDHIGNNVNAVNKSPCASPVGISYKGRVTGTSGQVWECYFVRNPSHWGAIGASLADMKELTSPVFDHPTVAWRGTWGSANLNGVQTPVTLSSTHWHSPEENMGTISSYSTNKEQPHLWGNADGQICAPVADNSATYASCFTGSPPSTPQVVQVRTLTATGQPRISARISRPYSYGGIGLTHYSVRVTKNGETASTTHTNLADEGSLWTSAKDLPGGVNFERKRSTSFAVNSYHGDDQVVFDLSSGAVGRHLELEFAACNSAGCSPYGPVEHTVFIDTTSCGYASQATGLACTDVHTPGCSGGCACTSGWFYLAIRQGYHCWYTHCPGWWVSEPANNLYNQVIVPYGYDTTDVPARWPLPSSLSTPHPHNRNHWNYGNSYLGSDEIGYAGGCGFTVTDRHYFCFTEGLAACQNKQAIGGYGAPDPPTAVTATSTSPGSATVEVTPGAGFGRRACHYEIAIAGTVVATAHASSSLVALPAGTHTLQVRVVNVEGSSAWVDAAAALVVAEGCFNGVKDEAEQGVDCGGACGLCGEGQQCDATSQCLGVCNLASGTCDEGSCTTVQYERTPPCRGVQRTCAGCDTCSAGELSLNECGGDGSSNAGCRGVDDIVWHGAGVGAGDRGVLSSQLFAGKLEVWGRSWAVQAPTLILQVSIASPPLPSGDTATDFDGNSPFSVTSLQNGTLGPIGADGGIVAEVYVRPGAVGRIIGTHTFDVQALRIKTGETAFSRSVDLTFQCPVARSPVLVDVTVIGMSASAARMASPCGPTGSRMEDLALEVRAQTGLLIQNQLMHVISVADASAVSAAGGGVNDSSVVRLYFAGDTSSPNSSNSSMSVTIDGSSSVGDSCSASIRERSAWQTAGALVARALGSQCTVSLANSASAEQIPAPSVLPEDETILAPSDSTQQTYTFSMRGSTADRFMRITTNGDDPTGSPSDPVESPVGQRTFTLAKNHGSVTVKVVAVWDDSGTERFSNVVTRTYVTTAAPTECDA